MATGSQFGTLLKQLRLERNMTQSDLQERSGISARAISNLEVGVNTRPRVDTVRMLADGLGLSEVDRERFFDAARGHQREELSVPAIVHRAPQDLPDFVGREREIALIGQLVHQHRLVTLTGVGGCGKTRLALAATAGLSPVFSDGIWFVDLAALRDPLLVPAVIASALSVPNTGQRSILDALRQHLRDKRCLIVLDNYEHLLEAAPLIPTLLEHAPHLTVLVTSRAELQQPGEHAVEIAGLALPDLRRTPSSAILAQSEAVRLFTARARVARGGVPLPESALLTIARICRRLDGLPLAIELAAARCAVFSPEEILERLADHPALLASGRAGVSKRHRSLRAALTWSYDLLPDPCQVLFRRLSIFAGGATLAAIEQICYAEDPPQIAAIDGLQELTQQKLVRAVDSSEHETRYLLLETVREFGLAETGEAEPAHVLRQRHADFFLSLAERAHTLIPTPQRAIGIEAQERERDNLRVALDWFIGTADVASLLRLSVALMASWQAYLGFDELQRALETALSLGEGGDPNLRAELLYNLGSVAMNRANHAAARAYFAQAQALQEQHGHLTGLAASFRGRGNLVLLQGDYRLARQFYQQALEIDLGTGDRIGMAKSQGNLGIAAFELGEFPLARQHLEASLVAFRDLGDPLFTALCLENLGKVMLFQGLTAEARACFEEGLALGRAQRHASVIAECLDDLGRLAWHQGDLHRANACFAEGLHIRQNDLRDIWGHLASLENFVLIAAAQQQPIRAATLWGAASALQEATGRPNRGHWREYFSRALAEAHSMVSGLAWQIAVEHGRALSLTAAINLALGP